MGSGTKAARTLIGPNVHADLIDNMKDQLLIVLIKRLANDEGKLKIPCEEIDDTYNDTLAFSVDAKKVFHFQLGKKS